MTLLLTADWHLDRAAWGRHPDATGDSLYALRQVIDLAARHDCPVVAAGDVFDTAEPDSATVHAAVDELNRLGLPVYFVQGQHERADPPWLSLSQHAVHLHARRIRLHDGPVLAGWDYCADLTDAHPFLLNDPVDLFVTHQVFAEAMATAVRATGKVAELPSTVNRVLSGDYHEHRVTSHSRYQLPPVELISPGSTHYRAVNEPGPKAVHLMTDVGRLTSIPLDTRPVRQWTVRTDGELGDLLTRDDVDLFGPCPAGRPAELNRPVVHLRVGKRVTNSVDRLRERLPRAFLHVTLLADRDATADGSEAARAVRPGAAGVLERCLDKLALPPEIAADARGVLLSPDTGAAVAAIYNRLTEEK